MSTPAKLPALMVPPSSSIALDRWIQAVTERLEVREGQRGDELEKVLTKRDVGGYSLSDITTFLATTGQGFMQKQEDGSYQYVDADELSEQLRSTALFQSILSGSGTDTESDVIPQRVRSLIANGMSDIRSAQKADFDNLRTQLTTGLVQTGGSGTAVWINVKDAPYSAVGDGVVDDTLAIQTAINAAQASGASGNVVYLPAGSYKITSNLTITWPNSTTDWTREGKVVLRGAGAGLTALLDYRTSVGTGGCVTLDFSTTAGAGTPDPTLHFHFMFTWLGGFSILKKINFTESESGAEYTAIGTGVGLYVDRVVSGQFHDLIVSGYATGMYFKDNLGGSIRDAIVLSCVIGIDHSGFGTFTQATATQIDNVTVAGCRDWGIRVIGGATFTVRDCTIESSGRGPGVNPGTGTNGGIYYRNPTPTPFAKGLTVVDCYFETCLGTAFIYIDTPTGLTATVANSIVNCTFIKTNGTYFATHYIAVNAVGTTTMELLIMNCGFRGDASVGSYSPNAARPAVGFYGTTDNVNVTYIANEFFDLVETPEAALRSMGIPRNGAKFGNKWNLYNPADDQKLVIEAGTGVTSEGVYVGRELAAEKAGLMPTRTNVMSLGSLTLRYKDLFLTGNANGAGDEEKGGITSHSTHFPLTINSGATPYSIIFGGTGSSKAIYSFTNNDVSLGTSTKRWKDLYLEGNSAATSAGGIFAPTTSNYLPVTFGASASTVVFGEASGIRSFFPLVSGSVNLGIPGGTPVRWDGIFGTTLNVTGSFVWGGITITAPPNGGTPTKFLKEDGTWSVPAGGGGGGAGTTTNAITFNTSGSGAASPTSFDGSSARTISYNTIIPPASNTSEGYVTTGAQDFAGQKRFRTGYVSEGATLYETATTNVAGAYVGTGLFFNIAGTNGVKLIVGATERFVVNPTNIVWGTTSIANPPGGSTNFLRADGQWAAPAGGGSGTVTSVAITGLPLTLTGTATVNPTIGIADASPSASGVVTTGAQAFAGVKTFNSAPISNIGYSIDTSSAITSSGVAGHIALIGNQGAKFFSGGGGTLKERAVVDSSALFPSFTDAAYIALGTSANRWSNLHTSAITWNGYSIPAPDGTTTTTFLRRDGQWATPAGGGTVTSVTVGGLPLSVTGTAADPIINIAPASNSAAGFVTTGAQLLAGEKRFTTQPIAEGGVWLNAAKTIAVTVSDTETYAAIFGPSGVKLLTGSTQRAFCSASEFSPSTTAGLALGTASQRWSTVYTDMGLFITPKAAVSRAGGAGGDDYITVIGSLGVKFSTGGGGTLVPTATMTASSFAPDANNTLALGASTLRWNGIHLEGNSTASSSAGGIFSPTGSNYLPITFGASANTVVFGEAASIKTFFPVTNGGVDLGGGSNRWGTLVANSTNVLNDIVWNSISITKPFAGGTGFLRQDGTWATPAGGGGTTTNAITFNNGGAGAASGSTFNGSSAITISTNTIGAYPASNPNGYTTNTGTVTGVTATAPVQSTGGTAPVISMPAATSGAAGHMTAAYASKLDGIAAGATNYTHPANHPPSIITQDASNRFVTDTEKATWNAKGNGTVTSVAALALGTTGTDLSSSVSGGSSAAVITLNVPTASADNRGVLSAADWTAFNAKVSNATHTGDVTGSTVLTLATVNASLGTFGSGALVPVITVNGKGLVTAVSTASITPALIGAQVAGTYATGTGTASGTNTGDNAANSLYSGLVSNATHTGDVTGSGALTIAAGAVTYAKMQNVSVTSRVLGRITAGAGVVEELTGANLATIIGITNTAANVNSVNGNTGAVTAAQISAAATSGYGYTPLSPTGSAASLTGFPVANDTTTAGIVSTGTQTFGGQKTFSTAPISANGYNINGSTAMGASGGYWFAGGSSGCQLFVGASPYYYFEGSQMYPVGNNAQSLGLTGNRWSSVWCTAGVFNSSDYRLKKDFAPALGLGFIEKLKPVSYRLKDTVKDTEGRFQGLIAQEVKETLDEVGETDFAGWHDGGEDGTQSLRYTEFIAPLIKAVQELSAQNKALEARLAALEIAS